MAQTRSGRYHGTGSWPPALDVILREVHRVYRRRGYFNDPKEFRGVCTGADSAYTKGAADDCMRLLKDAGVLIPWKVDDKTHLLISAGARQDLATCFKQNRAPDFPSREELTRRAGLLLKSLCKRLTKSRTKTQPAIAPVVMPPQATSPMVAAPPEPPTAPPQTQETSMSVATLAPASSGWINRPIPLQRFVAFLPPGAAREVWLYLYECVSNIPNLDTRVTIPNLGLPDGIECSVQDFDEWLEVFELAGVIECMWEAGAANRTFAFKIHPDEIHTIEIAQRLEVKVSQTWIQIMDRARREIGVADLIQDRLRRTVCAFVSAHFPDVHAGTAGKKLIGFHEPPSRKTFNWGIFYLPARSDAYLRCLAGLEPYAFIPMDEAPERRTRHRPTKAQLKATPKTTTSPQPQPELATVAVPALEPVIDPPAREREEESAPVSESAPAASVLSTVDLHAQVREQLDILGRVDACLEDLARKQHERAPLAAKLAELDRLIAERELELAVLKPLLAALNIHF